MITLIHHPDGPRRLGDLLVENLSANKWTHFRAAVAFVKNSGVRHIKAHLRDFLVKGVAKISAGVDVAGTSLEGLSGLLGALGNHGEAWVFHNEAQSTFHPKIYLFSNSTNAECIVGSGNLTEGGLFTNYEAFIAIQLDKSLPGDLELLTSVEKLLDEWTNPSKGTSLKLTPVLLKDLADAGYLPTEAQIRQATEEAKGKVKATAGKANAKKIFASVKIKPAPYVGGQGKTAAGSPAERTSDKIAEAMFTPTGFVITLQKTDVGHGQTTKGTSRRSPEIFLPKVCVHANREFWGWPKQFKPDPDWKGPSDSQGYGKMDRQGVTMRLGTKILSVNWWYNPDKKDFRLRNEALREAGNIGDILRIETADRKGGFEYYVEVVPQGTSLFAQYLAIAKEPVRNSKKKWGYY